MSTLHFDLRRTHAYRALGIRRCVFGLPGLVVSALLLAPFIAEALINHHAEPLLIATSMLGWILFVIERFRREKLKTSEECTEEPMNIADMLSYHLVLHLSTKSSVTPTTLLEAATESERGIFVLHLIGLERDDVLAALLKSPMEMTQEDTLQWCLDAMRELGTKRFDSTATIYAFLQHVPLLRALVEKADLAPEDLTAILKAEAFHFELAESRSHPLSPAVLIRLLGSIGRTWVLGYNNDLQRLTTNLSEHILSRQRHVMIHRDIVTNIVTLLQSGGQANILLLGESGTGKRTLVEHIAYRLRCNELQHSSPFTDVLVLKTALLLSGSGQSDIALLHALNDTTLGGRFILVIDDMSLLLKASDAKVKGILINILQAKNIRTICLAETADYHTLIKSDPLLDALLQKIFVEETDDDETIHVLLEEYFRIEKSRGVHMTYAALRSLLSLSKRYVSKGALPGKAVEILDEALLSVRSRGETLVTDAHIRAILSRRTRIDVTILSDDVKERLRVLQERLEAHIIGQKQAIHGLVSALKRSRLNIGSSKRPVGTFLFLGTTGLGKTETAKALAQEYFGSSDAMTRVDLNEYGDEASIRLLIGGQGEYGFCEGFLTKKVQDQPSSLVLLDEIEKAHPKILNLFLQILDEGMLIGGDGVKTNFRNTIIIATSNAGSHWMTDHPIPTEDAARESFRKDLIETIVGERTFSPEFVNRFDEVILFTPPSPEDVRNLAILMLDEVIQHFVKEKGIRITIEPDVIDLLVKKGFSQEYGAREMRRTITQTIENYLAEYLLSHSLHRGDEITIRREDLQ